MMEIILTMKIKDFTYSANDFETLIKNRELRVKHLYNAQCARTYEFITALNKFEPTLNWDMIGNNVSAESFLDWLRRSSFIKEVIQSHHNLKVKFNRMIKAKQAYEVMGGDYK